MELPGYTIILILAIGGVVIVVAVLKAALRELFEDVRKVSRVNQSVIRTVNGPPPFSVPGVMRVLVG
jgi:hypothetical protein